MKSSSFAVIGCLCVLAVGILLIAYPGVVANYLVVTIGILFLIPGVIGMYSCLRTLLKQEEDKRKVVAPLIVSVGSLLFGLWLIIMPQFFIGIMMYVLGVVLVLCGLSQLIRFVSVRQSCHVPFLLYVIPVLEFSVGLVVLFNPFATAEVPFIVLGAAFVVYALTDLLRILRYKAVEKEVISDAEIVEEVTSEETLPMK